MIEFRLSTTDLSRVRFAYSPLSELAAGLHALTCGTLHPLHRPWLRPPIGRLRPADFAVLKAVVPPRNVLAEFLYGSLCGRSTTIEGQLDAVATMSPDEMRADLHQVWQDDPLPRPLAELLDSGPAGVRRIADALQAGWSATIEPHWPRLRSVLDADLAYRTERLAHGGAETLLADLHPEVRLVGDVVRIEKARFDERRDLAGADLVLVPSVFTWPKVVVAGDPPRPPSLTYAARGIADVWQDGGHAAPDPLAALVGRTRATILRALDVPRSPTALGALLGQSPAAASQHLGVLRRCGLATAWRRGREVLYQRTQLATSLLAGRSGASDRTA